MVEQIHHENPLVISIMDIEFNRKGCSRPLTSGMGSFVAGLDPGTGAKEPPRG